MFDHFSSEKRPTLSTILYVYNQDKFIPNNGAKKLFHPNHSMTAWTSTNPHGIGSQGQHHGVNT